MNGIVFGVALFLLLNIVAGLLRVSAGPTSPDRMLAAQLFGTTGAAILLLLAQSLSMTSLRDIALVLAVLASIATVVFVRRWPIDADKKQNGPLP